MTAHPDSDDSSAIDLDNNDREAEIGVNGRNSRNSEGGAIQKKHKHQKTSNNEKDKYLGFMDPRGRSAVQRGGLHRKKDTKSKRGSNGKRTFFISAANTNKIYAFDKKRDKEFTRHFNESDDDEPDWDPRLRAVKKKFGEITLRKRREARRVWHDIEEAKSDSDSNDRGSSDSDLRLRALQIEICKKGIAGKGDKSMNNQKGDSGSKGTWDGSDDDTRSEHSSDVLDTKKQAKYNKANQESDEDPWFWDSKGWDLKGSAPENRGGTSKRDKDGNKSVSTNRGSHKTKTANLKNTFSRLKKSIEKVQLADFREKYYKSLIDGNLVDDASSITSKSSTSSDSTVSSIEHSIKAPGGLKGTANKFLDDSDEDDNEIITYTKKGFTVGRAPRIKLDKGPKEGPRLHWSDESSASSRGTSNSSTVESDGSQNDAETH